VNRPLPPNTQPLPTGLADLRGAATELHWDLAGAVREIAKLRREKVVLLTAMRQIADRGHGSEAGDIAYATLARVTA
jgi:hypothetical protein